MLTKINKREETGLSSSQDIAAFLNVKNAIMPIFAGTDRVLYLSDITGTNQIYSIGTEGDSAGWPYQLTFFEDRVTGLHANQQGTAFIFSRDRGGDEQDQFYLLEGDFEQVVTIRTLLDTPAHKNNFGAWRPDGQAYCFTSNRRHTAFLDVYVQALDGEPELVYQADETLNAVNFSPDGRYLLFRRANTNLSDDLFLLDLNDLSQPPRQLTHLGGSFVYGSAEFSPDGKTLYLLSDQQRDFSNLATMDLASGALTFLNDRPWDSEVMALSPDGTKLAYEVNEAGYSRLFVRDVASGEEQEVTGFPRGIVTGIGLWTSLPVWSSDSRQLAVSFNSPVHNADIWVYSLNNGQLRQLTFSPRGGLDARQFGQPEIVSYTSFDGLEIPALLFLPPGTPKDASTPFILFVHGGPESQTRLGWNPILQYYLSRGYGILAPNVRGSSGYGRVYLALDDVRKRRDSVADLKSAYEWLSTSGYCDPARVAVYGGSYGGFMVLMAVTTYPELWAAGVDIYGIGNMLTFMEKTSPYRLKLRTPEYGDPVVDRDFLIEISAIHKVDQITAPMMVVHGERDPRVPLAESEQMVAALRKRNHPVEYKVFPDEGHGIAKLKNKLELYPAIGDFLDKYLSKTSVAVK